VLTEATSAHRFSVDAPASLDYSSYVAQWRVTANQTGLRSAFSVTTSNPSARARCSQMQLSWRRIRWGVASGHSPESCCLLTARSAVTSPSPHSRGGVFDQPDVCNRAQTGISTHARMKSPNSSFLGPVNRLFTLG